MKKYIYIINDFSFSQPIAFSNRKDALDYLKNNYLQVNKDFEKVKEGEVITEYYECDVTENYSIYLTIDKVELR